MPDFDDEIEPTKALPAAVVGRPGESREQLQLRGQGYSDEETGYTGFTGRSGGYGGARSPLATAAQLALRQQDEQRRAAVEDRELTLREKQEAFDEAKFNSMQDVHAQSLEEGKKKYEDAAGLNKALAGIDYQDPNFHVLVTKAFDQYANGADDPRVIAQLDRLQGIRATYEARQDDMKKRIQEAEDATGMPMAYDKYNPDGTPVLTSANFAQHGQWVREQRQKDLEAQTKGMQLTEVQQTEKGDNQIFKPKSEKSEIPPGVMDSYLKNVALLNSADDPTKIGAQNAVKEVRRLYPQLDPDFADKQALKWANENPDDPRSKAILERNQK